MFFFSRKYFVFILSSFLLFSNFELFSHNQIICVTYVYHLNLLIFMYYYTAYHLLHSLISFITMRLKINYLKSFNRQFIFVSTNLFSC